MKIFSLQSKISLVIWSLVLGLFTNPLVYWFTYQKCEGFGCGELGGMLYKTGWPIQLTVYNSPFSQELSTFDFSINHIVLINFLFWILVSLIILSLIRHFNNKRNAAEPR